MLNISNANADHKNWHILYAEPDSYCVDPRVCKWQKCKTRARNYATKRNLPYCKNVDTTTPEPEDVVEPPPPPTGDTTTYTIVVNGKSYDVSLIPPTENTDGTLIGAIAKYVIYIGGTPDTNNFSFKADLNTSGSTLISLTPAGVYYMSIVAVDSNGYEGAFSDVIELN